MSVHSIDGTTWSTKLTRIGAISSQDKSIVFNNLGYLIGDGILREMYRQLDRKKAVGIDGLNKEAYGDNLEENLKNLIQRIRRGTYKPQPARIVEIPKEDGSTRPLAISCFEDKLVQSALSVILTQIYEPIFLPCSFGFRPNRSCHDALRTLSNAAFHAVNGAVVEIDLRKYFNSIPHGPLMEFLKRKISDRRLLSLIATLLKAPIQELDGSIKPNEKGCPQGSIVSPVLSNVFLHHVIDEWFAEISKSHFKMSASEIRYADDMVFVFHDSQDAERFYGVLEKRLGKYGIEIHGEKSRLLPSGTRPAERFHLKGLKIPTYNFLGFTCYWAQARNGKRWRLKVKSRSDRRRAKLNGLREYLRKNLNTPDTPRVMATVVAAIRGWMNYYAVSDNTRSVKGFLEVGKRMLFNWLNRRGGRRKTSWTRFNRILIKIKYPKNFKLVPLFPTPNQAKA